MIKSIWTHSLARLLLVVSRFVGVSKAPPVQYMPYCNVNFRPREIYCTSGQYIARAGDILHERAIYCPGAKYWPNSLELGQICPQYSIDCRATILTVGWLPYRKVNLILMRILYRQQGSKNQWDSLITNSFMNIIITIRLIAWLGFVLIS